MGNEFFEHPILNSPYEEPHRHWELDAEGQPTQKVIERRRRAAFITPIPKPQKRKNSGAQQLVFDEGKGLSTQEQQYDTTSLINRVRDHVSRWRSIPNPDDWGVTLSAVPHYVIAKHKPAKPANEPIVIRHL